MLTLRGAKPPTRTLKDWAAGHGIRPDTLAARLKRGWSLRDALDAPVRERGTKHCGYCGQRGHTAPSCPVTTPTLPEGR